jgi:hypothetical protein
MSDTESTLHDAIMGSSAAIQALAAKLDAQSPDRLVRELDERQRFRAAAAEFERKYSDVMGDPQLRRLALTKDAELADANPGMEYGTRLELVGRGIRDWAQKLAGSRSKQSTATDSKTAAGRRAINRPSTTTTWATDADSAGEESPQEVQETIAQIARSRGQARATVHTWNHSEE